MTTIETYAAHGGQPTYSAHGITRRNQTDQQIADRWLDPRAEHTAGQLASWLEAERLSYAQVIVALTATRRGTPDGFWATVSARPPLNTWRQTHQWPISEAPARWAESVKPRVPDEGPVTQRPRDPLWRRWLRRLGGGVGA